MRNTVDPTTGAHQRESYLTGGDSYFTEYTLGKVILYALALLYVSVVTALSILQPLFFDICKHETAVTGLDFENPGYDQRLCTRTRAAALLYLTPEECSFGRRIVISAVFGGLIGWERRSADRPAGIRTMSLVSLGSCLFSICSAYAFIEGPMNWDGSRVAAAIPSGVGFLGAGIIWKQVNKETDGHTVHGLTTAASVWLSAAVGIACSGELYFAASFSVSVMLILLRFGPRLFDDGDGNTDDGYDDDVEYGIYNTMAKPGDNRITFNGVPASAAELQGLTIPSEMRPSSPGSENQNSHTMAISKRSVSKRKQPSLMI